MKTRAWALIAAVVAGGLVVFGGLTGRVGGAVGAPGDVAKAEAAERLREAVRASDLVSVQRGGVAIIISAPHGGLVRVKGSKEREGGVKVRDVNTAEIALLTAQRITAELGAKPYFVIAQFSRKDADANRSEAEGVENDAARAQWRAYHAAMREFVDECRRVHGRAIVIDIHGQVRRPEAIVRGTRNGQTVKALVEKYGVAALAGPDSVFGRLKAMGYAVLPELNADEDAAEDGAAPGRETFFDGGYIVAHYGSQNADGVDAIQVEIGAQRSNSTLKMARDLGDAIAHFARAYGLAEKKAD
ncbi:MAG: N-formylglutamate amidohydrolase [Phycisphaerales bacterium]|nr:N-formylglutamate amidohydrolase [Phycisphaerales bacterium]